MSDEEKTMKSLLRWMGKGRRTREEAESRWGHWYGLALEAGLVAELGREAYMRGDVRDLRTSLEITEAGQDYVRVGGKLPAPR